MLRDNTLDQGPKWGWDNLRAFLQGSWSFARKWESGLLMTVAYPWVGMPGQIRGFLARSEFSTVYTTAQDISRRSQALRSQLYRKGAQALSFSLFSCPLPRSRSPTPAPLGSKSFVFDFPFLATVSLGNQALLTVHERNCSEQKLFIQRGRSVRVWRMGAVCVTFNNESLGTACVDL